MCPNSIAQSIGRQVSSSCDSSHLMWNEKIQLANDWLSVSVLRNEQWLKLVIFLFRFVSFEMKLQPRRIMWNRNLFCCLFSMGLRSPFGLWMGWSSFGFEQLLSVFQYTNYYFKFWQNLHFSTCISRHFNFKLYVRSVLYSGASRLPVLYRYRTGTNTCTVVPYCIVRGKTYVRCSECFLCVKLHTKSVLYRYRTVPYGTYRYLLKPQTAYCISHMIPYCTVPVHGAWRSCSTFINLKLHDEVIL